VGIRPGRVGEHRLIVAAEDVQDLEVEVQVSHDLVVERLAEAGERAAARGVQGEKSMGGPGSQGGPVAQVLGRARAGTLTMLSSRTRTAGEICWRRGAAWVAA
ncbi:hypothetical protein ADL00_25695, partial [Streptomyces sp. AS58]